SDHVLIYFFIFLILPPSSSTLFPYTTLFRSPPSIVDQVFRSANSVHANIAEGYTRASPRDYLRFLDIARSSLAELESHLYFMAENDLISAETAAQLDRQTCDLGNMLVALMRSLTAKIKDGSWQRLAEEAAI